MALIDIGGHTLEQAEVEALLATDHPMVQRFRFSPQGGQAGQSLRFALVIEPRAGVRYQQQRDSNGAPLLHPGGSRGEPRTGARIEPVWRTLGGDERIGQGNRALWVEGGSVVAENQTFFPNQSFNDLGIGSALYVSMERLYRRLGIDRITLLAVDVGVYSWARQGFAFEQPGEAEDLVEPLERFLFGHGAPCAVDEAAVRESWDFANYDAAGRRMDGYRAGKAFMLDCAPPWHGVKHLRDETCCRVAEASRRETFARLPDKIEGASADLAVR